MDLIAGQSDHSLVGDDFQLADNHLRRRFGGSRAAKESADPSGQLLRVEGLTEVVVSAGLQAGYNIVAVGSGGNHHDGDVS